MTRNHGFAKPYFIPAQNTVYIPAQLCIRPGALKAISLPSKMGSQTIPVNKPSSRLHSIDQTDVQS